MNRRQLIADVAAIIPLSRAHARLHPGTRLTWNSAEDQSGGARTRARTLRAEGTVNELFVVTTPEELPDVERPPSVAWTLTEGLFVDPGSGHELTTDTIRTNVAEVHLAETLSEIEVERRPALVSTREEGPRLLVGCRPPGGEVLGGNVTRLDAAPKNTDLPDPGAGPSAGWTLEDGIVHQYR